MPKERRASEIHAMWLAVDREMNARTRDVEAFLHHPVGRSDVATKGLWRPLGHARSEDAASQPFCERTVDAKLICLGVNCVLRSLHP